LHYPIPLHRQPCFSHLGYRAGQFPVAEAIAAEELSLPIYPELSSAQIREVCGALRDAIADLLPNAAAA
jgi:dTDP-4-amino-4,6-dideoxygalactose transaminase